MFSQPYLYLYAASSVFSYAMHLTFKKIRPRSPLFPLLMSTFGLLSKFANIVFLILCAIYAEHWWHALIVGGIGFFLSVLIPPTKIEMILGYLGVIGAPLCTLFTYLTFFGVV